MESNHDHTTTTSTGSHQADSSPPPLQGRWTRKQKKYACLIGTLIGVVLAFSIAGIRGTLFEIIAFLAGVIFLTYL